MVKDIHDVIKHAKFGDDRLRGSGVVAGQISAFHIDFAGRPYNTLTLPCERVIHSRVNDNVDERGQRVRVQRPPDTPELTKSVKAARADTRDVTVDAQSERNVHAEQTNVAASDGNEDGLRFADF